MKLTVDAISENIVLWIFFSYTVSCKWDGTSLFSYGTFY